MAERIIVAANQLAEGGRQSMVGAYDKREIRKRDKVVHKGGIKSWVGEGEAFDLESQAAYSDKFNQQH